MLDRRNPEIYGVRSFDMYLADLRKEFPGEELEYFQSNCEGAIIDAIQDYACREECEAIIINPGAYTHYSYAIADALADVRIPVFEVHLSNIMKREEFRRRSVTAQHARGMICGFGLESYRLALQHIIQCRPL